VFSLYVLECSDGTLYIGHTDRLEERMRQHDSGCADAYTAKRKPLKLLHVEEFESRYDALAMERKLKGWTRRKSWLTSPATGTRFGCCRRANTGMSADGMRFDFAADGRYAQRERLFEQS